MSTIRQIWDMIYKSSRKIFLDTRDVEYLDTCPIKILNSLSDPKS